MSEEFELEQSQKRVARAKYELQCQYLCSCRLLQWMAERLPIDRRSSAMRGMKLEDWHGACTMLISAGVINSKLTLQMPMPDALTRLRTHFDEQLPQLCTNIDDQLQDELDNETSTGKLGQATAYSCIASSCSSSIATASVTVV